MGIRLNKLSEWVFEKGGPRLTLVFVAGDDPASVAMADEVALSRSAVTQPGSSRIVASWTKIDAKRFRSVDEFVLLDAKRPLRSLLRLRRSLFKRRIARAVLRFNPGEPLMRRWGVAAITADLLIYNEDGESHELSLNHPIAAWRFLRGEPLADIRRPTRFAFLREWFEWARVSTLLACEVLPRRRKVKSSVSSFVKSQPGCSVLCLPGTDAEQLDGAVRNREEAEMIVTSEALLPGPEVVEQLRRRLQQSNVWLVCTRGSFKHLLRESWAPHRPHEAGTFCLGATSSLFAFRRDVFLELGGLSPYEKQMPRHGWAALSLRAWLRGYKTVYAGDIEFRTMRAPELTAPFAGPPLAPLLAACDDRSTKARLLHRYARQREFRASYRQAVRQLNFPVAAGKTNGKLTPLAEEGAVIFEGCANACKLRIAVVAPELPYPPANSAATRLHNLLRRLASHCEIYLFAYADKTSDSQIEALLEYCTRLVVVRPGPVALPHRGMPAGVGRYQTESMRRHLDVLLPAFQIHLVHVESTKLAAALPWLKRAHVPKLLSTTDLRSSIHWQVKKSSLGKSRKEPWRDARRWRRYEKSELPDFDCVATPSQPATDDLVRRITPTAAGVVQNGVDLEHFRPSEPEPERAEVLLVAEFDRFENISAFDVFTREIWPRVLAERPSAQLTVVAGSNFREHWRRRFRQSLPQLPNVSMLGRAGDFKPLYERTSVVVAPALAGNGASLRILEALAMKRAVVSTKVACEGLTLEPGRDLLVAGDAAEFAAAVSGLLADRDRRGRLGESGRARVEANYDWDRAVNQLLAIYEQLLKAAYPR